MLYNVGTNTYTFTTATDPGVNRKGGKDVPLVLLGNNKVFIMGGLALPNNNVISLYGPISNTCVLPASPPYVQRANATATLLQDGNVLIVGGKNSLGTYETSAEIYNPISDTFSLITATLTTGRYKHRATLLADGKVLIAGGANATYAALDSLELYDPVSKTITTVGIMRTPRCYQEQVLMNDGRVLIMGGKDNNGIKLSSCEIYSP